MGVFENKKHERKRNYHKIIDQHNKALTATKYQEQKFRKATFSLSLSLSLSLFLSLSQRDDHLKRR